MIIGNKNFDTDNHTYIMGILNVTTDSFSDGGTWNDIDRALRRTEEMMKEGADIIDIGGESARPGYTMIPAEEEIDRTAPVIEAVKKRFDIPVSADTYKSAVARAALQSGADMINDIWGLVYDKNMAGVIAEYGASCCIMHNRHEAVYNDLLPDIISDLEVSVDIALNSGIKADKIVIDPGIGFGKTYEMNLLTLKNLDVFKSLGYPVLLGCSRTSVIGLTLDVPADQRLEGTIVTTVKAVFSGCAFVRVHDIKENFRAVKMAEAVR